MKTEKPIEAELGSDKRRLWFRFEPKSHPTDKCKLMVAIVTRSETNESKVYFCALRASLGRCLAAMRSDVVHRQLTSRERSWMCERLGL